MRKFTWWAVLGIVFLLRNGLGYAQTDVLTQHNDLNRTGWNDKETMLNQANVTPTSFGLLYKRTVDNQIYAQPLYVSGVNIGGVAKNVVFVATVNNTVYAFDADDGTANPYWIRNFTPTISGIKELVPSVWDIHASMCGFGYTDFQINYGLGQGGFFGIVGTPVIDKGTNTLYFVSRYRDPVVDNHQFNGSSKDQDWTSTGFFQQLHALDLSTGLDKFNSPVTISAQVTGTGDGAVGGIIQFDPRRENQRGGLVLSNGIVYIPYAGHCDMNYYHGWILGYNAADLTDQKIRYVTTPGDGRGGIWMSGAAPAVDASGNLFFATGNGSDASVAGDPGNVALSVVKAAPDLANNTLKNISWFKPAAITYNSWNSSDLDFGTGVLLIPGTNMLLTAHKGGNLMLMNQNIPAPGGEFNPGSPYLLGTYNLNAASGAESHSSLSYFGGATTQYVYQFSEYTNLSAYPVNSNSLGTPIVNTTLPTYIGLVGGFISVSSDGTDPSTAIVWVTYSNSTSSNGSLHALKADNIRQELWNSDANPSDWLGYYAKMSCVTIANGKVYAPTFSNSLNVYGLLGSNTRCINNVALNKTATASSTDPNYPKTNAFDANQSTRWANSQNTTPQYIYVDLGQRYDICKVQIFWNDINSFAKDFTIDVSDDLGVSKTWTTVNTVTGNSLTGTPFLNEFNEHTTARFVRMNATTLGTNGISIAEMLVFGSPASNCISPAVASLNVTNITQNSATLGWNPVTGVTDYIVRYKSGTVNSYVTRLVQDASGNPITLNINALTCGFNYEFDIQSDCGSGQVSLAAKTTFTTLACSSPCTNLTRFSHGDLGDINAAGMSCYQSTVFTVTGAGSGIGGNGDQFQFNYASLSKDEEFIMHVASQDVVNPQNQAGIMMRDSVTDISRFIFIGKTGDNNLSLVYRSTPGGLAVSSSNANSTNASYFRIVKSGTQYSAFYGSSKTGPWTQMGATQDLGFGTQTIFNGMAVSSLATTTSTATFDNLTENASTLPVQLLNFTAINVQNQYVSLSWQTSMEENNDHFEVERSTDGSHFTKIVTVKAVGNSSITQSYSAMDNEPVKGINLYRLKQVDYDNHFSYSPVVTVKFGSGVAPLVYPNPVNSVFTAVQGSELIREIVMYNIQGRAVQFAMGNSTGEDMKVNISGLAKGIYILKIKTDSKIFQVKIVRE